MIFGVAGGLADYFEVDPVLVRLVLVLLAVASGGVFILVYIVAAIIMPSESQLMGPRPPLSDRVEQLGEEASDAAEKAGETFQDFARQGTPEEVRQRRRNVAGLILVTVGLILLFANFGWWWFSWSTWWPVALIVAGIMIIYGRTRGGQR